MMTSGTMPTIVYQVFSSSRSNWMRLPIGDSSGNRVLAMASLITVTGMRVEAIAASNSRPCIGAMRKVSKYDGLTVRKLMNGFVESSP